MTEFECLLKQTYGYKVERKALSTIEFKCLLKQTYGCKYEKADNRKCSTGK